MMQEDKEEEGNKQSKFGQHKFLSKNPVQQQQQIISGGIHLVQNGAFLQYPGNHAPVRYVMHPAFYASHAHTQFVPCHVPQNIEFNQPGENAAIQITSDPDEIDDRSQSNTEGIAGDGNFNLLENKSGVLAQAVQDNRDSSHLVQVQMQLPQRPIYYVYNNPLFLQNNCSSPQKLLEKSKFIQQRNSNCTPSNQIVNAKAVMASQRSPSAFSNSTVQPGNLNQALGFKYIGIYAEIYKMNESNANSEPSYTQACYIRVWSDILNKQSYYDCICGRRKPLRNLKAIIRHTSTHMEIANKVFKCPKCSRVFSHYLGLNSHQRTHKEIDPHLYSSIGEGSRYNPPIYSSSQHDESDAKFNIGEQTLSLNAQN
jgi:hypothetical protein